MSSKDKVQTIVFDKHIFKIISFGHNFTKFETFSKTSNV